MIKQLNFISPTGAPMALIGNQMFNLISIDGFTSVDSDLSSVIVPFVDGDTVTNVQARAREITLYLRLKQDVGIELAKQYVLGFVKLKKPCKLSMVRNDQPLEIEGIVTYIDLPRFEQGCTMQVSMHCAQPYWTDVDYIINEIRDVIAMHHFPLVFPTAIPFGVYDDDDTQTCTNDGDVSTGMLMRLIALDAVTNPKVVNADTGEYIGINDTLTANDEVIINTNKGQKSITKNGVNIINKIMTGSTFLQLESGVNAFNLQAASGASNIYLQLEYKRRFI